MAKVGRVIGEDSGRTKLTYEYPTRWLRSPLAPSLIEWKATNGLQILKAIEFIKSISDKSEFISKRIRSKMESPICWR